MKRIIFSIMLAFILSPGLASAIITEADLEIVSFEVLSAPETVQVGEVFEIILQKVVSNNGPFGPVDAVLTYNAIAPLGSSISPIEQTEPVEDLAVGEYRTVLEIFEATLDEVGLQTFTFINIISLDDSFLDPGLFDPDLSNNQASLEVTISAVPIPAAAWLFGSGLLGLIGVVRRKKAA